MTVNNPSLLVKLVATKIANIRYPPTNKPIYKCKNTKEAAENTDLLCTKNWDVQAVLSQSSNTILHPGNEFQRTKDVQSLLRQHCDLKKFETLCKDGEKYSLQADLDYPDEVRLSDLKKQIAKRE